MKFNIIGKRGGTRGISALLIAALTGMPALAADLPIKSSTPYNPPAAYNWTGCYLGINGGGARSDNEWAPPAVVTTGTTGPSGFFGGGQVGCDYQTGPWVFGVEGQFDFASATNALSVAASPIDVRTKLKMFGTAEGRVGYAFDRVLPYVKAGLAGARFWQELDTALPFTPLLGGNQDVLGIAVGAGFEVAVLSNVSFKAEYNFLYLGTNGAPTSCISPVSCAGVTPLNVDIKQNIQSVMFGMNYRFGLGPFVAN